MDVDVDMVGAQAFQAAFAFANQVITRRAFIIRAAADPHPRLRGDQHIVAAAQNLAQNLFCKAGRIQVGGVEQVHPDADAKVNQAAGLGHALLANHGKRPGVFKGEGGGAETFRQDRSSA